VSLAPAEHREITARLAELPRSLAVKVLDPDGMPQLQAWVGVFGLESDIGDLTQSDLSGVASFPNIVGPRVGISVECAPWARVFLRDVEVQRTSPVEVRLQRGARLVVRITDEAGAPREVDDVQVFLEGHHFPRLPTAPEPISRSRFEFNDLPSAPIELMVVSGDRELRRTVYATEAEVTIAVPR
jgi:hypothetical protein